MLSQVEQHDASVNFDMCGFSATARLLLYISDRANAEVAHSALIYTAVGRDAKSRR